MAKTRCRSRTDHHSNECWLNVSIILVSLHRHEENGAHPYGHRRPVVIGSSADDAGAAVPSSRSGRIGGEPLRTLRESSASSRASGVGQPSGRLPHLPPAGCLLSGRGIRRITFQPQLLRQASRRRECFRPFRPSSTPFFPSPSLFILLTVCNEGGYPPMYSH